VSLRTRLVLGAAAAVAIAVIAVALFAYDATSNRLHNQIDFGFETTSSRGREREVSDERRELHERIDALKKQLGRQQTA